jgi:hypothetical protein
VLGAGGVEAVGVRGVAGGTVVAVIVVVVTSGRRRCTATAVGDVSVVAVNARWLAVIVGFDPVAARGVEDVRPVFVGACGALMAAVVALMVTGPA